MKPTYPESWRDLHVVLSHDWLTGMRGGERCLELLCDGMPDSEVFCLVHEPENISDIINAHPIHTSRLQRMPFVRRRFRWLLPLLPRFVESMSTPQADLMVSMSHCVAKGLKPQPDTRHLCYCFTPMRYGIFYEEYFGANLAKQVLVRPILARLSGWDARASDRVDRFVAISHHVRRRIREFYDREADVVYPPVDTDRCTPGEDGPGDFDLIVSALVPYKKIDLAVDAYRRTGYPLKIVGTGSDFRKLRSRAAPNVEFLGWQSDGEILDLYRACRFLIFPGEEDFGIVPVEAQACGRPVVAFGRGGLLEILVDGETGVFFRRPTADSLIEAVEAAASRSWNSTAIRQNALRFSTQRFIDELDQSIQKCLSRN